MFATLTVWDLGVHVTVHSLYCNMLQLTLYNFLYISISCADINNLSFDLKSDNVVKLIEQTKCVKATINFQTQGMHLFLSEPVNFGLRLAALKFLTKFQHHLFPIGTLSKRVVPLLLFANFGI